MTYLDPLPPCDGTPDEICEPCACGHCLCDHEKMRWYRLCRICTPLAYGDNWPNECEGGYEVELARHFPAPSASAPEDEEADRGREPD
jgi:hypothetical protein